MIGMAEVTVCALWVSLLVLLSGQAMSCKHTHTKKNKNAVELRVIETM